MDNKRQPQENTFQTHDGVSLFYRHWPATQPRRGAVVMFHRGHEHSGRNAHLADELNLPDFDFFAWDARGHGRSPGERGHSPSLGTSVRDIQSFIDHIQAQYGVAQEDIAVLAQSVGAVLAATWVHDYAPRIRCLVLASPAFKVKLYVPFARPGLKLLHALRGNFYVNSYVKSKFLTHDIERQQSFDADPLIARAISVNILLALYEAAERVVADAQAITVPTQLLISGADWVVHHAPQHDFFDRLGTPIKEKHVLGGFFHDTLGEADRGPAVAKVRDFILNRFAEPLQRVDLRDADRHGPTHDESLELAQSLPALSPRGLYWSLARANMRLGGWLSDGVALGQRTGFDSGSTLDYVYRNKPAGLGWLGRTIDGQYLNSIGWRGIRQRKVHLEELLRKAIGLLRERAAPVRIMDIAAGHGRYVLEAIEQEIRQQEQRPESILLRDYSDINVSDGTRLIAEKGLADICRFEKGDAFNRESLTAVQPRPTIGIVSGLYELFPDNDAIRRSLAGLADAVEPGGYLLYTCQPWHPQLELIARALTSHRGGQAWVMRRRTQAEMDQLVEEAGFTKCEQRIDEWGIFTVSLARRNSIDGGSLPEMEPSIREETKEENLQIRQAGNSDVAGITKLFYETIQTVNSKDYPQDEIDDWSSWHTEVDGWNERIAKQYFIVAVLGDKLVGFASLATDGYLDFMFVHKDHQGQGIASRLLSELEKKAIEQGNQEIYSEVSITAKAFFEKRGFVVKEKQLKKSRNKELENYRMAKGMA